jgi:hypothetical protein
MDVRMWGKGDAYVISWTKGQAGGGRRAPQGAAFQRLLPFFNAFY